MFHSKYEITDFLQKKKFQKRIDELSKKYAGQKLIIYGAGMTFEAIRENFDLTGLDIIGIADMRFQDNEEFAGYRTFSPESFMEEKPDAVLIAMTEYTIAENFFKNNLFEKYQEFNYEPIIKLGIWDKLMLLFLS